MENIKLHCRDEHGYTEQIRLFLAEVRSRAPIAQS